jgi:hypothetical protein
MYKPKKRNRDVIGRSKATEPVGRQKYAGA